MGWTSRRCTRSRTSIRSSSTRSSSSSSSRTCSARLQRSRTCPRRSLRGQAAGLQRRPARQPLPRQDHARDDPEGPRAPQEPGHRAGLQARRHLRRGVRGGHAVLLLDVRARSDATAGATPARAPILDSFAADDEIRITDKKKVVILGGGPTASARASSSTTAAATPPSPPRRLGFESVMINSNPETVSTDYDTSDLLFFEPLTLEDTLNIIERLNGGATSTASRGAVDRGSVARDAPRRSRSASHRPHRPVRRADAPQPRQQGLVAAGVPIIGTSVDSIDLAEDRDRFDATARRASSSSARPRASRARSTRPSRSPLASATPCSSAPATSSAGAAWKICSDEKALRELHDHRARISDLDDAPVLIDKFLDGADRVDVDVVADFRAHRRGQPWRAPPPSSPGVMEHIEHAGIHSGDSACTLPPSRSRTSMVERIATLARDMARELRVCGLMNIQLAVKGWDEIYISRSTRAPAARCPSSARRRTSRGPRSRPRR
jgi:hypothetical protein